MNFDKGYLEIVIGPMCSGKTTYLFDRLNTFVVFGKNCLYINHSIDTRGDVYSSHNENLNVSQTIHMIKSASIKSLYNMIKDYDVIAIDEGQFFDDLDEGVRHVIETMKKMVFVGGLSGDFKRKKFGHILELIPYADHFKKLEAFCVECMKNNLYRVASFSKRVDESDKNLIVIGDTDVYVPVCRLCY